MILIESEAIIAKIQAQILELEAILAAYKEKQEKA